VKILVCDDHEIVHDALTQMLTLNGFEVVNARSGEDGVAMVVAERPDLVLMDIIMPDARLNGIEACREILNLYPETPVIMYTAASEYGDWWLPYAEAVMAGAVGYVDKKDGKRPVLQAIEAVRRGEKFLDPQKSKEALQEWHEVCQRERLHERLSPREKEVLGLILEGLTNREISEELSIVLKTVEAHVGAILVKLEVAKRRDVLKFRRRTF
jgi:NarL family two-component system response regulator LiaR